MLYFIAVWMVLLVGCGVIGLGVLHGLRADRFERLGDRTIAALWLGLVVLTVACLAVSLVLPLSPGVGAGVLGLLAAAALLSPPTRSDLQVIASTLTLTTVVWLLSVATAIAALTSRQVTWVDTGLYHFVNIQWLAQAGTVPGLALLFPNFGFVSAWFALSAPLNADWFEGRVSAAANGFTYFLAVLSFLICCAHVLRFQARVSDWFWIVFSLVLLPLIVGFSLLATILVSPSPDLPILFLIGMVAWMSLVVVHPAAHESETAAIDSWLVPLALSAGAVTIKLVALPLLLVTSLAIVVTKKFTWQSGCIGAAIGVSLLSPFLFAGLITSGCPLYPSGLLCLNFPWSLSPETVQWVSQSTHEWASWYGSPPVGIPSWLWSFWQWLRSERMNQLTALLMGLGLGSGVYIYRGQRHCPVSGWGWVGAITLVGVVFLMKTAPFFRFMLAYLLLLPVLAIAVFSCQWLKNHPQSWTKQLIAWTKLHPALRQGLPLFLTAVLLALHSGRGWQSQVLLPPPMKQPQVVQKQVNGISYFEPAPLTELCWATRIPCSFEITQDVILRDPDRGLRGGFVRKPGPP